MIERTHPEAAPTPLAVVTEYLIAFLTGDLVRARGLMHEDFAFRAPLMENGGDKEAFFAGADRKSAVIRDFHILRMWADGDEVSTVYEIEVATSAGEASMLLHEWHTVHQGRLLSTTMIFDTQARAAQLIHHALAPAS
jgi:hypothetical protein